MLLSKIMPLFSREQEHMRYRCSILLPHAIVVVSYESKKLSCRSRLLSKMATYELDLGRYQDSYQHAVQSYEESLEAHGKNSVHTRQPRALLRFVRSEMDKEDIAPKLHDEDEAFNCFAADEVDEVDEAEAAWNSWKRMQHSTDPAQADALLQKALDQFRACSNNIGALDCLIEQAIIAEDQKIEESESLYRQALQLSLDTFGDKHPQVFKCMFNLGRWLQKQGNFAEAGWFHRLALRGREEIYGDHITTMESNDHLAWCLGHQGQFVEAEILSRRIIKYHEKNPECSPLRIKLAMTYHTSLLYRLGMFEEAEDMERMVWFNFRISPIAFGINSGRIPTTQDNVAYAEQTLRTMLEHPHEQIGPKHSDTILKLDLLAECLEVQEKWDAAEKYRRQSLGLHEHHEGKESLETIPFHRKLAVNLYGQGKGEAALLHLQHVLERLKSVHPKDTGEIQELEKLYHQYTIIAIPGQGDKKDVEEETPAHDTRPSSSADNERHSDSKASSAEIQGNQYPDGSPPRKRTKF